MRTVICLILPICLAASFAPAAADGDETWTRSTAPVAVDLQLFHSTHAFSLPTTEVLQKGNFEFEISHRFIPAVSEGIDYLYGFDGPVNMRIALGYAVRNDLLVTLGRSNLDDNLDLWVKYKALRLRHKLLPTVVAVRAGWAWSAVKTSYNDGRGNIVSQEKRNKRHVQYYFQGIINTLIKKRLGLGLTPSYLVNRDIRQHAWKNSFILGTVAQAYITRHFSFLAEWSPILTDKFGTHNPVAMGIELETGGHFFKVFLTNQTRLNPSQYLAGADEPFGAETVRLGFLITRLI